MAELVGVREMIRYLTSKQFSVLVSMENFDWRCWKIEAGNDTLNGAWQRYPFWNDGNISLEAGWQQ